MNTSSSSSFGEPQQPSAARQDSVGNEPSLSPASAELIDSLFGNGLGSVALGASTSSGRVIELMKLLELPPHEVATNRELLIDLTIARVSRAAQHRKTDSAAASFVDGDLSPDDDDALEALVEAGMDVSRVPGSLRNRAAKQLALLGMLDESSIATAERDTLVTRTLATIQEHIQRDESRLELAATGPISESDATPGFRARFRLSDMLTVAALILVGFGVLAPITSAVQGYSRRAECQGNLSAAGLGFGLYAGSNKDALPLASASPVGRKWWFVGKDPSQSNAANLYTLVRTGNVQLSDLACSGNEHAIQQDPRQDAMDWGRLEEVSYSFQNMFATERPNWSASTRTIVLIDRSPVIPKAFRGEAFDPIENSPNHGGHGQAALYNDGSVVWLRSPVLENGDNIWLPRRVEQVIRQLMQLRSAEPLQGDENPASADDVFVGP